MWVNLRDGCVSCTAPIKKWPARILKSAGNGSALTVLMFGSQVQHARVSCFHTRFVRRIFVPAVAGAYIGCVRWLCFACMFWNIFYFLNRQVVSQIPAYSTTPFFVEDGKAVYEVGSGVACQVRKCLNALDCQGLRARLLDL